MGATRALPGTGRRDAPLVTGPERVGGRAQDSAGIRETFPYMAHNGAPHPATRSATCHRPRVRSQPRGGTRGGPAAGGRLVTVLRTPRAGRGAHLYSSLEPLEVPWPASTSYRVPHGGLLRGSSHPTPTPAPGKLPCDPNWPLQPVITAPVWFFFSGGRKFRLHRDDLFSVCSFLRSRKLPRPGGRRSS